MREGIWSEKRASGFTMVELLTTFVILGILISIAIPAFSVWLPNYRLTRAARDIYSNLQLAKLEAVRSNGNYAVVFNPGSPGGYEIRKGGTSGTVEKTVDFLDYDEDGNIGYGKGNAGTFAGTSWGDGDWVTFSSNSATFDYKGIGSSGYVYITNSKNTAYAIGKQSTGFIVLLKWRGGGWQ